MPPLKLRASIDARNLQSERATSAAIKKQLALTVDALERARGSHKPKPVAAAKIKPRSSRDVVRVCLGDTHGSSVEPNALAMALADIKTLDPDEIILLGDHVNCGGFLAQHHVLGFVAEIETASYEDDIAHANAFLDAIQAAAPRAHIEYLEGNHERRVETWAVTETLAHRKDAEMLRRAFAPQFLLHLESRGIPYRRLSEFYDSLPVPGVIKRGKCHYLHGFSTAKHAVAVTQQSVAGNVVFGHTHRHQADLVRRVSVGVVGSWNPGCLCKLQPLWQHGKPTDWTHGFAVQLVAKSGDFLHLNVPIIGGNSQLSTLFKINSQPSSYEHDS